MKKYLLLFSIIFSTLHLSAQEELDCDPSIYRTPELFEEILRTTLPYGENMDNIGVTKQLTMHVYDPLDNTAELRPMMVFAHGGSFIGGNKNNLRELCELYSSMGYVTASIDYRLYNFLGGLPDSLDLLDVAVKSTHDMKAAVRFLKGSVDDGNPFRIDTNFVTVGGTSAGAITAVQMAYLDASDTLPQYVADILEDNGGLEGSTFSDSIAAYSDKVHAVINGSGAVYRAEWIDSTDEVTIYSYHGDADDVVPFGAGVAAPGGIPIINLLGSSVIKERCEDQEIDNILQDVPGGGHTDIYDLDGIYGDSLASFFLRSSAFIADQVCEDFLTSNFDPTATINNVQVYPNPVSDQIYFPTSFNTSVITHAEIIDLQGRPIQVNLLGNNINTSELIPGIYLLKMWDVNQVRYQSKFIKQ